MVENAKINFSISPYCTLLFSRKENLKCSEVALLVVLFNDVGGSIVMCEAISIEILPTLQWSFTCIYLLKSDHENTQTRCKVYSNLSILLQLFTFVLLVTFINLEQLSNPTLVLLFKLKTVNDGWKCIVNFLSK